MGRCGGGGEGGGEKRRLGGWVARVLSPPGHTNLEETKLFSAVSYQIPIPVLIGDFFYGV